jgi:hypothetical protein
MIWYDRQVSCLDFALAQRRSSTSTPFLTLTGSVLLKSLHLRLASEVVSEREHGINLEVTKGALKQAGVYSKDIVLTSEDMAELVARAKPGREHP